MGRRQCTRSGSNERAPSDPAVQTRLTTILECLGHRVTSAPGGAEGILAYRQEPAGVVLCDVYMPGKDGIETLTELLQEFPAAKVISMAGDSIKGMRAPAPIDMTLLGAVGTLQKPFTPDALAKILARVLPAP
jgi:CheY-like chemotaxis protein